jgi:hypothetical protein
MTVRYFLCSNDKEMLRIQCGQKNNKKYHIKVTIKLYGGSNTLAQVWRPAPVIIFKHSLDSNESKPIKLLGFAF